MRSSRLYYLALGLLAATPACSQQPPTVPASGEQKAAVPASSEAPRATQQAGIRRDTNQRRDTDRRRRDTDRRGYSYRFSYYPYYQTYPPVYQSYGQSTVVIRGYQYQPGNLDVPLGTTVTWINQDSVAHTVTSPLPDQATTTGYFDGVLQPGQSYSYTFNLPGRIDYYCRFHPGMRGSVTVGGVY